MLEADIVGHIREARVLTRDFPFILSSHVEKSYAIRIPLPTRYCKPEIPDACTGF
jgi:RNase P/RNase MRP subunit p30